MQTTHAIFLVAVSCGLACAQTTHGDDLEAADRALKSGDYTAAKRIATEAASRYERTGDRDRLGKAINTASAADAHKGDYAAAITGFERSMRLAREVGDTASEIRRQNNIGAIHFIKGDYVEAFSRYQAALGRLAGSESQPWYTGIRQLTLTNLAVLHQQLGQHRRALELYQELRSLPLKMEPSVEAQMLTNLAVV